MKIKYLLVIPLFAALFSCVKEDMGDGNGEPDVNKPKIYKVSDEHAVKGMVNIKMRAEAATRMSIETRSDGIFTGIPDLNEVVSTISASNITRTFGDGGEFEARRQKAGINFWYTIKFDESIPVSKAMERLSAIGDIEYIEPMLVAVPHDYEVAKTVGGVAEPAGKTARPNSVFFNDPYLPNQWHYHNDGSINHSTAGCDIQLLDAWEFNTGHPDVIVCVVDGGIDFRHQDLAGNMWTNSSGECGFNFFTNSTQIEATDHGTHVAGTIAAVNNNGIGVCGIAGGNGTVNSGVKLMSAQIFAPRGGELVGTTYDRIAAAIAYGADNGAVISQNSWGLRFEYHDQELPQLLKDNIDYFIEYAGTDRNGNQTGPMKGGIVIFAAGNDNTNYIVMPAAYDAVFSVAACAPNYLKASYSNYGNYVDITAPGGELRSNSPSDPTGIWSTLPNDKYGVMQGTSMACPHVSGIAALAISHLGVGKPGFTNEDLWDILKNAILGVDINYTTGYDGRLGAGYISAYNALNGYSTNPPAAPTDLWAAWHYDNVDVTWSETLTSNQQKSSSYEILISEEDITGADFDNPPTGARKVTVRNVDVSPLEGIITCNIDGLDPATYYYISITALDRFDNRSAVVMRSGATTTVKTQAAVTDLTAAWWLENVTLTWSVTGDNDNIKATSYDVLIAQRVLTDKDFADMPQDVTKKSVEVGSKNIGDELSVSFDGLTENTPYYIAITGLNSADDRSSVTLIEGSTIEDVPPTVTKLKDIYFPSLGHQTTVDMTTYFDDDLDPKDLRYEIIVEPASAIDIEKIDNNRYTFTAKKYGQAKITVTAHDTQEQSATGNLTTMCRDDSRPIDIYPNPVRDYMYIRLGKDVKGQVDVVIYNSSGRSVLSQKVNISTFEPGKVDVSKLSPGSHSVTVTYNNKETKGTITKY